MNESTASAPRPFRTVPRVLDELTLASAPRLPGGPAWEPADEAVARIQAGVGTWDIVDWLLHPDERVVIAALRERRFRDAALERTDLRLVAYSAAMRAAEAEGVAWTPVLDELAISHRWPHAGAKYGDGREILRPSVVLAPLGPWLSTHADEASVTEIASAFRANLVRRLIAEQARVLPLAAARKIGEATLLDAIAANPGLTAEGLSYVLREAVDRAMTASLQGLHLPQGMIRNVFKGMEAAGRTLSAEDARFLADVAGRPQLPLAARRELVLALASCPTLPPACMEAVYTATANDSGMVKRLTDNAAERGPLDLLRKIARNSPYTAVHERIAETPRLRADAQIRSAIISWGKFGALQHLLPARSAEEFQLILSAMVRATAKGTREWLETNGLPSDLGLTPAHLAPLLEADDAPLRTLTITLLSDVRTRTPEPGRPRR